MKEKFYIRIKRRIDQGKNYAGYYSMIGMSILLCKAFGIESKLFYIIMVPVLFFLCWLVGYLHEIFIIKDEQNGYFELNPGLKKIIEKLDELNKDK